MSNTIKQQAAELVSRVKFVCFTTLDETGMPETRLLFNLNKTRKKALSEGPAKRHSDFSTYLGTNTSSTKIRQIRNNNRVCLYYSDNRTFEGCSVKGRVVEVADEKIRKAVWQPGWTVYYQGGRDGGDFSLLRFIPEKIKYYHGLKTHEFNA